MIPCILTVIEQQTYTYAQRCVINNTLLKEESDFLNIERKDVFLRWKFTRISR